MWGPRRGPGGASFSERGPEQEQEEKKGPDALPPLQDFEVVEQRRAYLASSIRSQEQREQRKLEALNRALTMMGMQPVKELSK